LKQLPRRNADKVLNEHIRIALSDRDPDHLRGAAAAIGLKGRLVSVAETVANLTAVQNQTKKPNDIWSEWQDLNLRPLRPERSALPD
jgi:hypothetical protein